MIYFGDLCSYIINKLPCYQPLSWLFSYGSFYRSYEGKGVMLNIYVSKHLASRGVGGMPPGSFCILDSLNLLLMHSPVQLSATVPATMHLVCHNNHSID